MRGHQSRRWRERLGAVGGELLESWALAIQSGLLPIEAYHRAASEGRIRQLDLGVPYFERAMLNTPLARRRKTFEQ